MQWSDEDIEAKLGMRAGNYTTGANLARYIILCVTRERERLARIIESTSDPKAIAAAIRDDSEDQQIFMYNPQIAHPKQ